MNRQAAKPPRRGREDWFTFCAVERRKQRIALPSVGATNSCAETMFDRRSGRTPKSLRAAGCRPGTWVTPFRARGRRAPVPWNARNPVDLRMEIMVRLGQGEKLSDLCREYGISRKTGEKFKKRFRERGPVGLTDQSRAPKRIPHKTPSELVEVLLAERRLHPTWGPRKLKEVLERRLGRSFPAPSTIGDVLAEHGLIEPRRKRRRHISVPTGHRDVAAPNEVWCIDYKGQFRLGDGSYCYPLTITDKFSRFIVCCEGMAEGRSPARRNEAGEARRIRDSSPERSRGSTLWFEFERDLRNGNGLVARHCGSSSNRICEMGMVSPSARSSRAKRLSGARFPWSSGRWSHFSSLAR